MLPNTLELPSFEDAALEDALVAAIREPAAEKMLRESAPHFLRAHGVSERNIAASQPHVAERFLLYRELVQQRFVGLLEAALPRTLEYLGAEQAHSEVADFLAQGAARSPYLRDVAGEFVSFARARWALAPHLPAFLGELARHELMLFELGSAENVSAAEVAPTVSLASRLIARCPLQLADYHYAVHRLPESARLWPTLELADFRILAYRDAQHQVRCLELSALAAELMRRLLQGDTLGVATAQALHVLDKAPDDNELAAIADLLQDLEARGILSASV